MKKKVIVVGQTPPPYHGQAMMIEKLVNAKFENLEIHHIRMSYSDQIDEIGKVSLRKIMHLLYLVLKTYKVFWRFRPSILVYYPVGNRIGGVLRDWVYLSLTRILFKRLVLNFQAAGLGNYIASFNYFVRSILYLPFKKPDLSIILTKGNPADDQVLQSRNTAYVPNGIEDVYDKYKHLLKPKPSTAQIFDCLYLGMVKESKGVTDLIRAIDFLVNSKEFRNVRLRIVGSFSSPHYEDQIKDFVIQHNLGDYVVFEGLLVGEKKWDYLLNCDVLCFPTFFEKESFGNVIVEAFMMSKPVIGTNWRGTSTIIDDGKNGSIVELHDFKAIGNAIKELSENPKKLERMSKNARVKFENNYTLQHHLDGIESSLMSL